jgi:hypothetical protein
MNDLNSTFDTLLSRIANMEKFVAKAREAAQKGEYEEAVSLMEVVGGEASAISDRAATVRGALIRREARYAGK